MIDFIDRIQTNPNRIKLTAVDGESNTYDYEKTGAVSAEGTDINRTSLMALQGFHAQTTKFNADGSITQTNAANQTLTTTFNADGSITEKFVGVKTITKTTKFNADGSISEVIS